jgi:hypothetical protein
MSLSFFTLALIFSLPYIGGFIAHFLNFKIKKTGLLVSFIFLSFWISSYEIEYKILEFCIFFIPLLFIVVFLFQKIEKHKEIHSILGCLFFVFHIFFSIPLFLFQPEIENYFDERFILAESENYFITFEQKVSFGLDMHEYFILNKKIVEKKIYKRIEKRFVEISSIKIDIKELETKVIITNEGTIHEFGL